MSFLRDVVTELFVGGTWTDISTDVYVRDTITISRGRKDEASQSQPSTCQLTLDNRTGKYSSRKPTGPYYGQIGRNTPIRVALRTGIDTFTRTVSGGWGSADTGQAWTTGVGLGGTVQASDWAVAAGVATHSVPAVSAYRLSYLASVSYRDVDVRIDVTLPFANVTGDQVEPANLALRGTSSSNYYLVRVAVEADESVTVDLRHADDSIITAAVTVPGLTHTGQTLRVRAQAEGQTLRAKVWPAAASEPYGWHVTGNSTRITTAGWVGVRSGVSAANSNTKPIVFSYDQLEIKVPRFAGEVAAFPQRWDVSGNDVYVPIEAAGISRRLGQGASPLESSLRRALIRDATSPPVVYWPCEDGPTTTGTMASGIGGPVLRVLSGAAKFAANTDFVGSGPIPQFTNSGWGRDVPTHTLSGWCQTRFLLSIPSGGAGAVATVAMVATSGTVRWLAPIVDGAGGLKLQAYSAGGALLYDSGFFAWGLNGAPVWMSVEFRQNGADVQVNLVTVAPGATVGLQTGIATIAGQTAGIVNYVLANPNGTLNDVGCGHISVHNIWESLFALGPPLAAWVGETAGARASRLCGEEGVPFAYIGDLTVTSAMGPQTPMALADLLAECAAADLGILYETRGEAGLAYRTRSSLYSQAATLDLDYAGGQVAPPFEPVDDDQQTRNDVEVKRTNGSAARSVLSTGRMSVLPPDQGGVGRYDTSVTLNVATDTQLPDLAGWLMHLGTVDETRYPTISVNLANAQVQAAGIEPQILAVDVGDRITVSHPMTGQTPDQITQIVQGLVEVLTTVDHTVALNTTPESPYEVLTLDDPDCRLDSDDSTLAAGATSTATSLSVAVAGTSLWTTSAGDFPFDIAVAGERMTVTTITGSSSPQTFTVVRSVNGVVKAQSSGATVGLFRPAILAL